MRCLFVLILYIFFFGRKAYRSANTPGVSSLKNVDFSNTYPRNSMSHLRVCVSVLEMIFVGQCEVFVCLEFVHFPPWP